MKLDNFRPLATYAVSASADSPVTIPIPHDPGADVRVHSPVQNSTAFIRFTDGSAQASLSDMPFAPGTEVFSLSSADLFVSVLLQYGTGTVYFTIGGGN